MTREQPEPDCFDVAFQASYPMDEPEEVALEDYVRALALTRRAEAMRIPRDPSMVGGVHVCGLGAPLSQTLLNDIEDFARSLVRSGAASGLGWS